MKQLPPSFFAVSMAMMAALNPSSAAIVFDRGLPMQTLPDNLNNDAGADRSNVAWADLQASTDPADFWLPGDNFELTGSGPYVINTIRIWSTDSTGLMLWGGPRADEEAINIQSTSYSITPVNYPGTTETYQLVSGAYVPLYQIDFSVSIPLNGGAEYVFFLEGPPVLDPPSGMYRNSFLHASNADLSESPQHGADNLFLWLSPNGEVTTWDSKTGDGTSGAPASWDKESDGNVQVFATTTRKECEEFLKQQKKEFKEDQKDAKEAFKATNPTKAQQKAFHDQQKADKKAFHDYQKAAKTDCKMLPGGPAAADDDDDDDDDEGDS